MKRGGGRPLSSSFRDALGVPAELDWIAMLVTHHPPSLATVAEPGGGCRMSTPIRTFQRHRFEEGTLTPFHHDGLFLRRPLHRRLHNVDHRVAMLPSSRECKLRRGASVPPSHEIHAQLLEVHQNMNSHGCLSWKFAARPSPQDSPHSRGLPGLRRPV